jgi:hypothetical protein
MTESEARDYRISIESSEKAITAELDSSVVLGIYSKYGARCLEEVSDFDLPDVFNEMTAIESDLR